MRVVVLTDQGDEQRTAPKFASVGTQGPITLIRPSDERPPGSSEERGYRQTTGR